MSPLFPHHEYPAIQSSGPVGRPALLSPQLALPSRDAYIERTRPEEKGNAIMGELWILIAIVAGWFVLNRYVLPKFGITT